jgi:hypothetical protein
MSGIVDESAVCLGVYGKDLDPAEVSKMLRCEPSSAHRRGDRMKSGTLRHMGAWLLSVRGNVDPQELTAGLLDRLPVEGDVWADLAARYDLQLRLGLFLNGWNRGLEMSSSLVGRIAGIHARVIIDIYGPDRDIELREA